MFLYSYIESELSFKQQHLSVSPGVSCQLSQINSFFISELVPGERINTFSHAVFHHFSTIQSDTETLILILGFNDFENICFDKFLRLQAY